MNLGRAIKLCRTQRALTQSELADKVGISTSYLSLLEQNKRDPSISIIEKLAETLNVPFSVLMFLAADKSELSGLDKELVEKLSYIALELINENSDKQATI